MHEVTCSNNVNQSMHMKFLCAPRTYNDQIVRAH
jgi:hypothetical protein